MTTTRELLDAFGDAFNRHDLDAIMSMMTEDCIFLTAAGDDPEGKRIVGQEKAPECDECSLRASNRRGLTACRFSEW